MEEHTFLGRGEFTFNILFKKLHENITLKVCFLSGTLRKSGPFNVLKNSIDTHGQNFFFLKNAVISNVTAKRVSNLQY